ncbi:MAG TPA: hypothetical protein VG737_07465 [Cyclobacteriaceae bacterium]|nr:hypothetical protein [Cyclobacteriaceae bacterium]
MKPALFLLLFLAACATRPAETESTTDSLAMATDTVVAVTANAAVDMALPESPLAKYHGEYRLQSSSSAEQARMTIRFEGDNKFSYSINYNVADFCSDDASGTFTVDAGNTGVDPISKGDDDGTGRGRITFKLGDKMITVTDGINEFGVGKCNLSGEFIQCDGPCPAITSEDYGIEEGDEAEGDSVQ